MGVCIKLATRSLRKNKGRTLITLMGIVLSVLMVCTIFTLLNSMLDSAIDSIIEKDGNWHIAVYNTTAEQIADLEAAEGVLSTQMISIDENDVFRITLKNPDEVYEFASRYLSETTEYSYHTELLSYLGISQSESIKSLIMGIAAALLLIIAVGAISLIYNAFAISVSERTKELGLLSSIGATQKDIRTIVYSEALLLGTVAIPIGIVLGLLTSWALLDIFGAYMGKVLYVNIGMRLHINGWLLILKDGSYHADVRYMSEAASERLSQDINANPNDRFDYENYYDTFFSVNFTVGNYDFPLEFRPNYGGISILIPESRMPEFNAEITSKEIMIQSPNYANIQKNTTDYLTSVGLAEDVSIFSSAESYESQRNFAAMIKLFSTSFLILLTVISCANVFNVITTSLNMRKREFAVLRSVGMTVNKLFAMLCIENLRNGLLAILIGGISSLPLCYLIYKSIVVGAVIDFVFPLGAFVISSLAMFLIMFLTSLYGLWKIKNGDIIADVRNDFV
jgi:ABC-type antimicrobial peptide transport system permease subunit